MATNYVLFATSEAARSPDDVTIDVSTGATLVGTSAVVNFNFDEDVFTGAKGKIRLLLVLEAIKNKIVESSTTWPLT